MARKVITVLTDDLDGGAADRTVEFSLDGVAYVIDLSDQNAGALRKALDVYITAGRRMGRGGIDSGRSAQRATRPGTSGRSRAHTRAIREWAAENGYQISERGRIPTSVVEAYNNR
ncbi:Lsr2 protein [Micromonospora echinaurantiaca]|uniref:Lsr2 protein n=1 Tax=Micromonospora echinaurantiaca TaxID=47857 RepID=A0A1C5IJ55_9ACTN|nr:Lsr2 family protein [Micromonospora echinaurantiaca]SCG58051.1 Lsr2 protein [Micromonospora echinaurantiaca]